MPGRRGAAGRVGTLDERFTRLMGKIKAGGPKENGKRKAPTSKENGKRKAPTSKENGKQKVAKGKAKKDQREAKPVSEEALNKEIDSFMGRTQENETEKKSSVEVPVVDLDDYFGK